MKFASKLDLWIAKRGLTQGAVARASGLSPSAISDMVAGKRRPYLDQGLKLARVLGLSLDFLADDDQDEPEASPAIPEDVGAVMKVYLALKPAGLTEDEAIRRLAAGPVKAPAEGPVEPVRSFEWLGHVQNLDAQARREQQEQRERERSGVNLHAEPKDTDLKGGPASRRRRS